MPRDPHGASSLTLAGFGLLLLAALVAGAAGRIDAHLAARACSTARFRSPTTPTRRSSSSRACRACSPRRSSARRWPPPASCSRRCCAIRSPRRTRSASRAARRSARCWRSRFHLDFAFAGVAAIPLASFAGSLGALGIVYALASARRRGLSTIVLLLAGVTMTAFFSALILFVQYLADFARHVPHRALADGRRSTSAATRRSSRRCRSCSSRSRCCATLPRVARPDQPRRRRRGRARRERRCAAERLALVSASLATGAAVSLGGPVGVHRHHRAAPRAADRRVGSPARAAGVGALRRGVPHRLRRRRAHRAGRRSSCRSAS